MDDGGGVETVGVWWSVSNGGGLEGKSRVEVLWWWYRWDCEEKLVIWWLRLGIKMVKQSDIAVAAVKMVVCGWLCSGDG